MTTTTPPPIPHHGFVRRDDDSGAATGDTGGTTGDTGVTSPTGGIGPTSALDSISLDDPVNIIVMAGTTGESQNAVPNFADGAQFAIDDLNAAGGVGGLDVETTRIPAPLDQAGVEANTLEAVDQDPTAIIGYPNTTQSTFTADEIAEGGIPTIYMSGNPQVRLDAQDTVGNEWTFLGRAPFSAAATVLAQYIVEDLGFTNIGLLCINNAYGTGSCDAAQPVIEASGGTVVARETHEQDAADVNAQALALAVANPDVGPSPSRSRTR